MARTRMLKPDLRNSEKVASWPWEVRYFWVLLWGYLDDYGKGKDNPLLIKADCLPLDEGVSAATVDGWLWVLEECGVIARYTVDGADFLVALNWDEHQRPQHPTASKIPDQGADSVFRKRSGEIQEPLIPSLVKSSLGLGLVKSGSSPGTVTEKDSIYFDLFWSSWPRKEGRAAAAAAFAKAARKDAPDLIVSAARAYAQSPHRPERQFVPHAATWLNGERWNDPLPLPPEQKASRPTPGQRAAQTVRLATDLDRKEIEA